MLITARPRKEFPSRPLTRLNYTYRLKGSYRLSSPLPRQFRAGRGKANPTPWGRWKIRQTFRDSYLAYVPQGSSSAYWREFPTLDQALTYTGAQYYLVKQVAKHGDKLKPSRRALAREIRFSPIEDLTRDFIDDIVADALSNLVPYTD